MQYSCPQRIMKIERKSFVLIKIVIVITSVLVVFNNYENVKYFFQVIIFMSIFFYNVYNVQKRQRLQIIPDALHIQTSETLSLEIPIGKHLVIMVLIFIFMGHTLVRFCYQCGKKYIIFHRQQNSNENWSNN